MEKGAPPAWVVEDLAKMGVLAAGVVTRATDPVTARHHPEQELVKTQAKAIRAVRGR
jgi:hypothetical protein